MIFYEVQCSYELNILKFTHSPKKLVNGLIRFMQLLQIKPYSFYVLTYLCLQFIIVVSLIISQKMTKLYLIALHVNQTVTNTRHFSTIDLTMQDYSWY